MAALPEAIQLMNINTPVINIAIYADDVALWASAPTKVYSKMQQALQDALTILVDEISKLGLTLSTSKTAVLQYHPTARASINRIYEISGTEVTRFRTHSYLGFLLDDRISWRPAVKSTLIKCRQHLNAIRTIIGSRWGTPQAMMMKLYRGLTLSRLMYALPLVHISNAQSLAIETLQRIAVRLCLGLPRYAPNIPTLVEGRMNLVQNPGKELTLRHIARQTTCRSTGSLLNRLRSRPLSRLGYLATESEGLIDAPAMIYLAPPPYAQPLKINESIPMLKNKQLTAQAVARGLAEELIEESFVEWSFQGNSLVQAAEIPEETETVAFRNQARRGWKPPDRAYLCEQPAATTSGATLQVGLLTQPLPTTSGACLVSIFQGPAYPRVAIPPHPSLQVTSDNQRGQASAAARGTLVSAASTGWQPAARTSGAALQGGLLTQTLPTTSGACFVSIFQGPAYPRVAIPPYSSPQVTSDNQRGQARALALRHLGVGSLHQLAARTSGAALQGGLLTQPLPTTSGACFVSIFQGPAYPRVAIPPYSSPQVTSFRGQARASAKESYRGQARALALRHLGVGSLHQLAARTSGAALQGGLLTQPLPTTSGACFVSIFQGPAYPRVAIPPHSSLQVTSDNQRGQASAAARDTLVSAASTSWQPAAKTPGAALQGGLLTQPLPTTSGACFVSIFQGPAYPRVAIPPHSLPQVTSDNQRGQASVAARGTSVSAAFTSWKAAAKTPGAALQGGLLTQPLPTTSGACFVSIFQGSAYPRVAIPPHSLPQVTSDNQRGQASVAARGTLVSAASTSWVSRKIKQLENENHRLVRQAALQKTREAKFRSHLHKVFTADQLAALSRSSNRWSKWLVV
ncbi:uncharacterized protein ISCGN_008738 [Ixodes scapularis]